ncbi:hypothetical protein AX14_003737 [Amanita brunnescens Koide BX004]|nr:hypothetical protein AX14_007191 [Amanita brunnescens Koide BX004]KAF8733619.1 hypothetical protein AX14_003737 [Amanita brunnescens Koide BX004]
MLAWSLNAHVMSGYEFLMQNYVAGDRICIFGFSRGAYTARSLAGMIHKVGLLPKDNHQQLPFAYHMYSRTDSVGWDQSNGFKKSFSVDVPIEFLGVWDTVDSVGLIPKRLPFTTSNTIVRTFRHAVSLDERRSKFKMNLWNRPTEDEKKLGLDVNAGRLSQMTKHSQEHDVDAKNPEHHHEQGSSSSSSSPSLRLKSKVNGHDTRGNGGGEPHLKKSGLELDGEILVLGNAEDKAMNRYESIYSDKYDGQTNVDEVWFSGCHGDIGGGCVRNGTRNSLARIPIRWMVRECFKTKSGIIFRTESLREIGIDPDTIYPVVLPRPPALLNEVKTQVVETPPSTSFFSRIVSLFQSPEAKRKATQAENEKRNAPFISEEDEELKDALSPKFDQLKLARFWWILEILPVSMRYQKANDQWVTYIGMNMGRPRIIPKEKTVKFHRSVKLRMEAQSKGKRYRPKPDLHIEPRWVD